MHRMTDNHDEAPKTPSEIVAAAERAAVVLDRLGGASPSPPDQHPPASGVSPEALDPSDVSALAKKYGISQSDAAALAALDRRIATQEAELAAPESDVPWLDARKLDSPPEPWNRSHFERDVRRAQAAGIDLPEDTWRTYAEQGIDGVDLILAERREQRLREMTHTRANLIEQAQRHAAEHAARVERQAESDRAVKDQLANVVGSPHYRPRP